MSGFLSKINQKNWIGGHWVTHSRQIEVYNPATGVLIGSVPDLSANQIDEAIISAHQAFLEWRQMPAVERGRFVSLLAEAMLDQLEDLSKLLTLEQGKPLSEAKGEIRYAASFLTWAAEEGKRVYGDILPASVPGKDLLVMRQPIGAVGCLTPWNFPSAMITRKIGPALAAGCGVVIKPSELTPFSALAMGWLAEEIGFPAGVMNVITGQPDLISSQWLSSPYIRKISFTGSTRVGKLLVQKSAEQLTKLSLELGGHAPFIVFDDADLDAAVAGLIAAKFRNAGQTCICPNRVFVHRAIYDSFLSKLESKIKLLKLGDGSQSDTNIGPLISGSAVKKTEDHIQDALQKGATLRCGGERLKPTQNLTNLFITPAILENCGADMLVFQEETFGPVIPVQSFDTEDQVIHAANSHPSGLAAYFYSNNNSRVFRVAKALEVGIVGVNDGAPSTAQAPFGGVKTSGIGREGGKYVMDAYTETKFISIGHP